MSRGGWRYTCKESLRVISARENCTPDSGAPKDKDLIFYCYIIAYVCLGRNLCVKTCETETDKTQSEKVEAF